MSGPTCAGEPLLLAPPLEDAPPLLLVLPLLPLLPPEVLPDDPDDDDDDASAEDPSSQADPLKRMMDVSHVAKSRIGRVIVNGLGSVAAAREPDPIF